MPPFYRVLLADEYLRGQEDVHARFKRDGDTQETPVNGEDLDPVPDMIVQQTF